VVQPRPERDKHRAEAAVVDLDYATWRVFAEKREDGVMQLAGESSADRR
jgi:hypothetical protein